MKNKTKQNQRSQGLFIHLLKFEWNLSVLSSDFKPEGRLFQMTLAFKPISPKWLDIFGWNFLCSISGTLVLTDIKMKKKKITELGHSDGLKIYINPSKIYVYPGI